MLVKLFGQKFLVNLHVCQRWVIVNLEVGMYRISVFQIRPEPDLARFMTTNPAGAGAGAGFQNLVQRKTTPELQ